MRRAMPSLHGRDTFSGLGVEAAVGGIPAGAISQEELNGMFHPWYVGHFEHDALGQQKLVLRRPLDVALLLTELGRVARLDANGSWYIQQDRFVLGDGYLRCCDFVRSREAANFMAAVAIRANAEIVFPEVGGHMKPAEFLKYFEEASREHELRVQRCREGHGSTSKTDEGQPG